MNQIKDKRTKRNSCLLIASVIIFILVIGAIFISKKLSSSFILADKELLGSYQNIEKSNDALMNLLINDQKYGQTIQSIENTSSSFNMFLDSIINLLITNTGGWKENTNETVLANPNNRNIPTQILIEKGLGQDIMNKIIETSSYYNKILKNELDAQSIEIPLRINMEHIKESGKTWPEYNFKQMPLMAVLPILRKFKYDETESKAKIYRFIANEKNALHN